MATRLECGTVTVNDTYVAGWASIGSPMGGFKDSGLGRRHGAEGILKYTEAQNVTVQRGAPIAPPNGMPRRGVRALVHRRAQGGQAPAGHSLTGPRRMANVFVTGFPGFLGSELVRRVLDRKGKPSVTCLVQPKFAALAATRVAEIDRDAARRGEAGSRSSKATSPPPASASPRASGSPARSPRSSTSPRSTTSPCRARSACG